jgi:uncharacterized protein (DUF427 family)
MPTASWNGQTLAQTDDTVVVEGNHYFPASALREGHFEPSSHRTRCGWKGEAHYYDVIVDGERNANAAWYYPEPLPAAENIRGRIAFWKGVEIA